MTHSNLSACLSLLIVHNLIDRIINFDIDIQKSTLCDFEHKIELKVYFYCISKNNLKKCVCAVVTQMETGIGGYPIRLDHLVIG